MWELKEFLIVSLLVSHKFITSCCHFAYLIFFIATDDLYNDSGFTSSTAFIGGLIGGVILLIVLIALVLAVIVHSRRLQKKQMHSINPEILNGSDSKL